MLVPSLIGIHAIREALENAKNKVVLSPEQISEYLTLYDEWKESKGNPMVKKDKLKGLQQLYKQAIYKR